MKTQSCDGMFRRFLREFSECCQQLPNKAFFFLLAAAWLALFQFLGNSTLGYFRSPSLPYWMCVAFAKGDLLESDDAYGAVVPFAVLILFWMKRKELLALDLRPWWPALLLVGLGLALHTLGYLIQQPRISIVALFTGLYGLMGLAWGPAWLRASLFPFCLFIFCVPLGSLATPITFRLRLLVCHIVQSISHLVLAIDVLRDGTILRDPSGRYEYEVAAACSGLRSLLAILALAVVLAGLFFRTWWKRLLMVAAAVPLGLLGNCLRMLTIIVAAAIGGPDWGRRMHEGGPGGILVALLYLPACAGLLLLEHFLRERPPPRAAAPLTPEPKPGSASIAHPAVAAEFLGLRLKGILAALVIVLIAADATLLGRLHTQRLGLPGIKTRTLAGSNRLAVELPERVLDYRSELLPVDEITSNTLPADTSFGQRQYQAPDGFQLDLRVVLMGTDRTSLHQPQFCLQGQGWEIDQNKSVETSLPLSRPAGNNLPVVKLVIRRKLAANQPNGPSRAVYVYWYVADGVVSSSISGIERVWLMTKHLLLTGVLQRWAYVTCSAVCEPGQEEVVFERLKRFIAASVPDFQQIPQLPPKANPSLP
jgi:exosortase